MKAFINVYMCTLYTYVYIAITRMCEYLRNQLRNRSVVPAVRRHELKSQPPHPRSRHLLRLRTSQVLQGPPRILPNRLRNTWILRWIPSKIVSILVCFVTGSVITDVYIFGSLKTPLFLTAVSAIFLDCTMPGTVIKKYVILYYMYSMQNIKYIGVHALCILLIIIVSMNWKNSGIF